MLLGQAYERMGQLRKTIGAFQRGVDLLHQMIKAKQNIEEKIRYRFALTYFQLARTYILLKQPQKALDVANAAMALFPSIYHITDIMALSLARLGRVDEAVTQYKRFAQSIQSWPPEHRYTFCQPCTRCFKVNKASQ